MINNKSKRDIKNIILSGFLLGVFILGLFFISKSLILSLTGIRTEAVVTRVENFSGARGLNLDYTFKDVNGIEYAVRKIYTNFNRPAFYEGQIITIAYDKNDVNNNVIVSDHLYIGLLFIIISLLIVSALLYGLLRKKTVRVPSK